MQKQIDLSQSQFSPAEQAEAVSLADELVSQYEMTIREYVEDDYQDKYDFWREEIEYDKELYEVWKEAVRNKQTVKLKYDSTTSGVSERLVDPYASRAPYVDGYCHTRNEVRMFRLDRVLELTLTDQKFEKIKDWRMNQFGWRPVFSNCLIWLEPKNFESKFGYNQIYLPFYLVTTKLSSKWE